jgi:hypothetical protein
MATKEELLNEKAQLEAERKRYQAERSELVLNKANPQLIQFVEDKINDIEEQLQEISIDLDVEDGFDRGEKRDLDNRNKARSKLKTLREQRKELEEAGQSTKTIDYDILQEKSKLNYYNNKVKQSPNYQAQQEQKAQAKQKEVRTSSSIEPKNDYREQMQLQYQNATYQVNEGTGLANILDRNGRPVKTDVYIIGAELPKGMPATREVPWATNIRTQSEQDVTASLNGLKREDRAKIQTLLKKYGAWDGGTDGSLAEKAEFDATMKEIYRQMTEVNLSRLTSDTKLPAYTLEQFLDNEYVLAEPEDTGPRTVTSKSFFSLSEGESKLLLDDYYRNTLGRAATPDELKQFQNVVKKRSERKPSVGQKTYQDGALVEERTLEPGFGEAEARLTAFRQAKARPEFAAYQLANTYYDAILAAAQSPINIQRPSS